MLTEYLVGLSRYHPDNLCVDRARKSAAEYSGAEDPNSVELAAVAETQSG